MQNNHGILRLFDLLTFCSSRYTGKVAFCSRKEDEWVKTTYDQYQQKADQVSYALLALGILKGDKIVTISRNRAEFNFTDMGIMQTGAVHVPLYATIDEQKLIGVLNETGCKIVFTGNEKIYRKVKALQKSVAQLSQVICFDTISDGETFDDFLGTAENPQEPQSLQKAKDQVSSNDIASITYISGSTTELKGILHSHADHIHNSLSIAQSTCITHEMNLLSLLPLAHSYERSINYCVQFLGATTWYNSNFKTIGQEMKMIRPDVIFMVPFLMQKLYDFLVAKTTPEAEDAKSEFHSAVQFAAAYESVENSTSASEKQKTDFGKVYASFREVMGGNIKMLYCGGAALNQDLRRFFDNCGMICYEGYGLTEAGPVVAHNSPLARKAGTVGKPVAGTIIKIAEDGEVLVLSPSTMKGYYNRSTGESPVDSDGWLHTGDLGLLDVDGFLTLTGVKKRIFKLSTGIYADPYPIEQKIEFSTGISKAFVTGINRDYLAAIICPDFLFFRKNFPASGKPHPCNADLLNNEAVDAHLHEAMKEYNMRNRGSELQVKYCFTADSWNTENELLNADGTLNRQALNARYREKIESIFSGSPDIK